MLNIGRYYSLLFIRKIKLFCLLAYSLKNTVCMDIYDMSAVIINSTAYKKLSLNNTAADCRLQTTFIYLGINELAVKIAYNITRSVNRYFAIFNIVYLSNFYIYLTSLSFYTYP